MTYDGGVPRHFCWDLKHRLMTLMKLNGENTAALENFGDEMFSEVHVRITVLDDYTALGTPITKSMGRICSGKGARHPSADLCNKVPLPGSPLRRNQH